MHNIYAGTIGNTDSASKILFKISSADNLIQHLLL